MISSFEPVVEDVPVGLFKAGGWVGWLVVRPPKERGTDADESTEGRPVALPAFHPTPQSHLLTIYINFQSKLSSITWNFPLFKLTFLNGCQYTFEKIALALKETKCHSSLLEI